MLTCRELIDFLDVYLEDQLPPMRLAAFNVHLMLCRDCRQYLDTYRKTIEISKQAMKPEDPVPAEVPEGLVKAIRESLSK